MQGKHKLRAERDSCGLTQKELGAAAGVSPSTISHIECHRGPNVPRDQLRSTKTKLDTACRLAVAVDRIPPGEYSLEEFISMQSVFTEPEMYEAPVNQRERERRRNARNRVQLKLVS